MKRFNLILVAALVLALAGGALVAPSYAGEGCSAHAKSADTKTTEATTVKTANAEGTEAKATKANVTSASGCCAAKATVTTANATSHSGCADKATTASAKTVKAGATCAYSAGAKTAGACEYSAANASFAKGELMDGKATLAKLAHCGIDCRNCDVDYLSAKLASGKCGSYTQEQWATMIRSAQQLDAETAEKLYVQAKATVPCEGDACPMKLVANELAAEQESRHN